MKAEVVTMSIEPKDIASLVIGVIFGVLYIAVCVVSAVKAVRDRRRILDRMAERKAEKERRRAEGDAAMDKPPDQPRRQKPNIKIIHDEERADRFSGRLKLKDTSDSSITDPSPHTETTTAEMAYSPGEQSISTSDVEVTAQDYKATGWNVRPPSAYGKERSADNIIDHFSADSTSQSRTGPWNRNSSNSSPDVKHDRDLGDIREDGSPGPRQNGHSRGGGHAMESDGVSASRSFHGFTKQFNANSSASGGASRSRYVCANYNPRRSSYAAAIANPSWIEIPPLRRHSGEPHHLAIYMRKPQSSKNHVSAPGHSQEGADNSAYDGADDTVAL